MKVESRLFREKTIPLFERSIHKYWQYEDEVAVLCELKTISLTAFSMVSSSSEIHKILSRKFTLSYIILKKFEECLGSTKKSGGRVNIW